MEYIVENTDIFDYGLKSRIANAVAEELTNIDKHFMYHINVVFNNALLNDIRVDEFVIPEEKLPLYLRGKKLDHKEKLYNLLSYQIKLAEEILEECDIQVAGADIIGRKLERIVSINVEIKKDKEVIDKSNKKNKHYKVVSVMPNEEYILETAAKFMYDCIKQTYANLSKAVGGSKILDEILKVESISDINKVYHEFEKQYGKCWVESKEYGKELQGKFLKRLKVETGEITDPEEIDSVKQKIVLRSKVLYEIPIYYSLQETFENKMNTANSKEKDVKISNKNSVLDINQEFKNQQIKDKVVGYICKSINGDNVLLNVKALTKNLHDSTTRHFTDTQNTEFSDCKFHVQERDSNKIIKNKITEKLLEVEKQYVKEGYFVDLEAYKNTIEYINFKALLKEVIKC